MMKILGDVHGKFDALRALVGPNDDVVQIGDFGFDYDVLEHYDYRKFKLFRGNHDNPHKMHWWPHCLGPYGVNTLGGTTFYFIGGAWSIDGDYRRLSHVRGGPRTWWQDEELGWEQLDRALVSYIEIKPSIMLSHECPLSIVKEITNADVSRGFGYECGTIETRTNICLERCLRAWQPDLWVFGHYHKSWSRQVGKTLFRCLNELELMTINE